MNGYCTRCKAFGAYGLLLPNEYLCIPCSKKELSVLEHQQLAVEARKVALVLVTAGWRVRTPPFLLVPEPPCFLWYRPLPGVAPILCAWNGENSVGGIPPWGSCTATEVLAWCPVPGSPAEIVAERQRWLDKMAAKEPAQ